MIVVKFIGGLGNQLFQYAYAYALAKMYDQELYVDLSAYDSYKTRNFELFNLNVPKIKTVQESGLSKCKLKRVEFLQFICRVNHLYESKFFFGKKKGLTRLFFDVLLKKGYIFNLNQYFYQIPQLKNKPKFLFGYFQSEKYFENVKEDLFSQLKPKKLSENAKKYLDLINNSSNSVAVSIRCGEDYLNTDMDVCDKEYFLKGTELIREKKGKTDLFVFSDDIDKVKQTFGFPEDTVYVENTSPCEGLFLISNCKNFVIANSSFSWWGAYLSQNEDKIIISPDIWCKSYIDEPEILKYGKLTKIHIDSKKENI